MKDTQNLRLKKDKAQENFKNEIRKILKSSENSEKPKLVVFHAQLLKEYTEIFLLIILQLKK